jgi:predicted dienelactone hydrolase
MARVFAAVTCVVAATKPAPGQYEHAIATVTDDGLQEESGIKTRDYGIAYPKNAAAGQKFPLIVYAHGAAGGGVDFLAYEKHLADIASYGYVVIAPKSCFIGCSPPKLEEPSVQGADICYGQWPSFVYENTRAIEYSKSSTDDWASLIDWQSGIGAAGHSMGGEVVSQLASTEFAQKYNVTAAVCEHCLMCIKKGDLVSTPALFMTGTVDYEVSPKKVKGAYSLDQAAPKSYRNQKGKGHLEMLNLEVQYNPAVASHAAAFFNVWIKGDTDTYYNQIYGNGDDSLCGYAKMKECEHDMGSSTVV